MTNSSNRIVKTPKNSSIDGIRALAITAVMATHAGVPGAALGWLGVDLFFVLSGFLITTLLDTEFRNTGKVHIGRFWGRRFLRLMPAYMIYALFVTILIKGLHWGWTRNHAGFSPAEYVASLWLYCINFLPQGGIWEHQALTLHIWSLAVEEQFYLLWPLLFLLLRRRQHIEKATWILVVVFLSLRVVRPDQSYGHTLQGRGFGILLGCAFALTVARSVRLRTILTVPFVQSGIALSVLSIIVAMAVAFARARLSEAQITLFGVPLVSIGFAALVSSLWLASDTTLANILSVGPLTYLGKISYGMYLYHMLVHQLIWGFLLTGIEDWNRWLKFAIRLSAFWGLTLALSTVSYFALEKRFLSLKDKLR
jgi:peptidoglycan/LPS O-acetylase OafA/YrhL